MFRSLINLSATTVESIAETVPESTPEAVESAVGVMLDTLGDKAMFALENSALGLLIVFAVLAVLFIIIKIAANLLGGAKEKKSEDAKPAPAPTPAPTPAPAPVPVPVTDDGEIVAVITAAISFMLEAEGKDPRGFRVVSFRRSTTRK